MCLPMLALLVFGGIQACDMIYLKHAMTQAAYEGSLEACKEDATSSDVTARVAQVLDKRGVVQYTCSLTPSGLQIEDMDVGTTVTVNVSVNVPPNLILSGFFPTPSTFAVKVVGCR